MGRYNERQDDDDGQGHGSRCRRRYGRHEHERVHSSPIEPMVGHHRHPIEKGRLLRAVLIEDVTTFDLYL